MADTQELRKPRKHFKLSRGERIFKVFNVTLLCLLAAMTLYPFWYVFVGSLTDPDQLLRTYFWPKDIYYVNYWAVFAMPGLGRAYLISILRIGVAVPAMLLVTCAAAFALSRKELILRKTIITYFFITMFFSGGLIPHFLVVKTVGLYNTFWVYVVPFLFQIWTMIVMKTAIQSLPEGLVDASVVDGASHGRIFIRIILPLSKAMLAALGLFSAVAWWNDWFYGLFYIGDSRLQPVQTFLQNVLFTGRPGTRMYSQQHDAPPLARRIFGDDSWVVEELMRMTPRSMEYAYIMAATIPIILLYPILQKYFVKGVLIGSMKE